MMWEVPTHLILIILYSTSQKSNKMGHLKQEQSVNSLNRATSQIFISANVNNEYGMFEAFY